MDLSTPAFWCHKHHVNINGIHLDNYFDISYLRLASHRTHQKHLKILPQKVGTAFLKEIVKPNELEFDTIISTEYETQRYHIYLQEMIKKYDNYEGLETYNSIYSYQRKTLSPKPKEGERAVIFEVALAGGQLIGEMIRNLIRNKIHPIAVVVFVFDRKIKIKLKDRWLQYDSETKKPFFKHESICNFGCGNKIPIYPLDPNGDKFKINQPNECEYCNSLKEEKEICPLRPIHPWPEELKSVANPNQEIKQQ